MQVYTYDSQGRLVLAAPTAKTIVSPQVATPVKRDRVISKPMGRPRKEIDLALLRQLRGEGWTVLALAQKFTVSPRTINYRLSP